ncbi:hypothetical protein XA26_47070 [Mycolicibacterium fortuitum]|uniref:Uncharacterized protein n=1 Tax=Mycolicibacterium fortuitum TaxID=1766 RepID=A0A0N9XI79_MYCFO|nr:hypothetical protein XA26_47070 [Mycolicibacterium fortuitum]
MDRLLHRQITHRQPRLAGQHERIRRAQLAGPCRGRRPQVSLLALGQLTLTEKKLETRYSTRRDARGPG